MTEPRILPRLVLVSSAIVTAALYSLPIGRTIGYPLVLLSTLAHEMGHGIAALMVGGSFASFQLFSDGSGVAMTAVSGRLSAAFVSAGGLIGPSVAAVLFFVLGKRASWARIALGAIAFLLVLALVFVVRNVFGRAFIGAMAALAALIAWKGGARLSQLALVFVGTELALSVYSRGDYLFTPVAETSAGTMPSDVAQMSQALFLPYWFWGAVCGGASVAVLAFGLIYYWRAPRI